MTRMVADTTCPRMARPVSEHEARPPTDIRIEDIRIEEIRSRTTGAWVRHGGTYRGDTDIRMGVRQGYTYRGYTGIRVEDTLPYRG
jgi:hypothetical protein